jgi:hypothetical protein
LTNKDSYIKTATAKTVKYAAIANTHLFVPIVIEIAGALCVEAIELIQDIGRRCTEITGDQQETAFSVINLT